MLYVSEQGNVRPGAITLVLMHFLGGSTREWDEVLDALGDGYRTVRIDLPGFGASAEVPGFSVEQMADAVEYWLGELKLGRYVLVGHSMSGKVSAVLARRYAERLGGAASDGSGRHENTVGAAQLDGLEGLVLVAPSPPGPEPMTDEKRETMKESLGEKKDGDRARAKVYIGRNDERDIAPAVLERTTDEVLKMSRIAWVAWLEHGSREDWADRVGVLDLPVLVVAGEKDGSLGPEVQQRETMPHFSRAELKSVAGCSHLIPLERPAELAAMLREFLVRVDGAASIVPAKYRAFIASERLSDKTREVLEARMTGPELAKAGSRATAGSPPAAKDDKNSSAVLNGLEMRTLRAICARVIPQAVGREIDIAGTIAVKLATGKGDGWRYAVLPPDLQAYKTGLDALATAGFNELSSAEQDVTLTLMAAKKREPQALWFEELRGAAVEAYVAHPAALARMGYSGIGVGGANTKYKGFVEVQVGEREAWEPEPVGEKVAR